MRSTVVAVVCGIAVAVLAGCSSSSKTTVSAACDQAMATAAGLSSDAPDAQVRQVDDTTLSACSSRSEWLAAARAHPGIAVGNTNPAAVHDAFCHDADITTKPAC